MRVQGQIRRGIICALFLFPFFFGPAHGQEPVRIGAILSETGSAKSAGNVQSKTLKMVVDEINRSGGIEGKEVELIIQDDRSDPAMATLAATKLLLEEGLSAVIGPTTSSNTMAVKDLFENRKIPLIALGGAEEIVASLERWVFKSAPSVRPAISMLLNFIKGMDISRIGLITSEDGFGREGRRLVMEEAAATGMEVTGEISLRVKEKDVTGKLETLMGSSPEALLCWSTLPGAISVVRGGSELEIEEPIFMPPPATSSKFLKSTGSASEGVILPATYLSLPRFIPDEDPHKGEVDRYRRRYNKTYGTYPSPAGGRAWDAIHLIFQAIIEKDSADSRDIRDGLERIGTFYGTGGTYRYTQRDHDGLGNSPYLLYQITEGAFKRVK